MDDLWAYILGAAGIVGALATIIINYIRVKEWFKLKSLKNDKINKIVDMYDDLNDRNVQLEQITTALGTVNTRLEELSDNFKQLGEIEKQTILQNKRQDLEIKRSLKQRLLTFRVLYSVLDGLSQLGANGVVTEMRKEIEEFMLDNAHQDIDVILEDKVDIDSDTTLK